MATTLPPLSTVANPKRISNTPKRFKPRKSSALPPQVNKKQLKMESFMARSSVLNQQKDFIQGGSSTAEYQNSKEDHPQTIVAQVAQDPELDEDEDVIIIKENVIEVADYEDIVNEEEEVLVNREKIIEITNNDIINEQEENSKPNKKQKQNKNKKSKKNEKKGKKGKNEKTKKKNNKNNKKQQNHQNSNINDEITIPETEPIYQELEWRSEMMQDLVLIHDELITDNARASSGTWKTILERLKNIYPGLEINVRQIQGRYQSYTRREGLRETNRRLVESMNIANPTNHEPINIDERKNTLEKVAEVAREILDEINETVGDFKPREKYSTKAKEIPPNKEELIFLNNLFSSMIFLLNLNNDTPNDIKLWNTNCCLFAIGAAWTKVTSQEVKKNSKKKDKIEEIMKEINETQKLTRTVRTVIELFKVNKNPKNAHRREIMKWTNGEWSREKVEILSLKLSNRKKRLRNKFKKTIQQERTRKWNDTAIHNESRVYDWLKKIIQEDSENITPMPKKRERNNTPPINDRVIINPQMLSAPGYWNRIWSPKQDTDFKANWIKEASEFIQQKLNKNEKPNQETPLKINQEKFKQIIMKKKNWSAPGKDGIYNYWLKWIDASWKYLIEELITLAEVETIEIPSWLVTGKTILLHKGGNLEDNANYRPITCLNTIYKLYTSILLINLEDYLDETKIMTESQRGAKKNVQGCVENILIDQAILHHSQLEINKRKKKTEKLTESWIDLAKAYDSVDHNWIEIVLDIHKIPQSIKKPIMVLTKSWKTEIYRCLVKFGRGIFQGDSLCPLLFCLCLNPISILLDNHKNAGYKLFNTKITHSLFIDDLKIYTDGKENMRKVLQNLDKWFSDIGMEFGLKKCAVLLSEKENNSSVLHESQNTMDNAFPITNLKTGQIKYFPLIKRDDPNSNYKYLGVHQKDVLEYKLIKDQFTKEFLQRTWVVWNSPLSGPLKARAYNSFAVPKLAYFWMIDWDLDIFKQCDVQCHTIMKKKGLQQHSFNKALRYLPRKLYGRGLTSVETAYKKARILLATKLCNVEDGMLKVVTQTEISKGKKSIFEKAKKFSSDFNMEIEFDLDKKETSIKYKEKMLKCKGNEKEFKRILKEANIETLTENFEQLKHQSKLIESLQEIPGLKLSQWQKKWRTIDTRIETLLFELITQCARTKMYERMINNATAIATGRTHEIINEFPICRACNDKEMFESMAHILCSCKNGWMMENYHKRHNMSLKPILWAILNYYGKMKDVDYSWAYLGEPNGIYDNEHIMVTWDRPKFTLTYTPKNRPDIILHLKKKKKIIVIEHAVPWDKLVIEREKSKEEKYQPFIQNLKAEYPEWNVQFYATVIGVLGSTFNLEKNLEKIFGTNSRKVFNNVMKATLFATTQMYTKWKVNYGIRI